jgi:hypothetical protein
MDSILCQGQKSTTGNKKYSNSDICNSFSITRVLMFFCNEFFIHRFWLTLFEQYNS